MVDCKHVQDSDLITNMSAKPTTKNFKDFYVTTESVPSYDQLTHLSSPPSYDDFLCFDNEEPTGSEAILIYFFSFLLSFLLPFPLFVLCFLSSCSKTVRDGSMGGFGLYIFLYGMKDDLNLFLFNNPNIRKELSIFFFITGSFLVFISFYLFVNRIKTKQENSS